MTASIIGAINRSPREGTAPAAGMSLNDLILVRVASTASGSTRAELQRDLAPIFGPRAAGTEFRRAAELAISALVGAGLVTEARGRLLASAAGQSAANTLLGRNKPLKTGWDIARDALVARAIGLSNVTAATQKAFERIEGLAGIVLQHHFAIMPARLLSATDLRTELAVVALERAFGNRIKTGLGKSATRSGGKAAGLPGKTARLLAAQLFKSPREVGSDGKLIVALAVEVAGASDETVAGLKLALLRSLIKTPQWQRDRAQDNSAAERAPQPSSALHPDNDANPLSAPPPAIARSISPPDMAEFASAVVDAARPVSEGWPGNRKAFISQVWRAIRDTRPDWQLTDIAFKGMLAEAHRSGHVVLAGADLKDRCDLKELEDSKILYKNTVWHFVRVED